jgi:hypothetical protein
MHRWVKKYPELSDISSASPYPIFWISGVSEKSKKSPEALSLGIIHLQ